MNLKACMIAASFVSVLSAGSALAGTIPYPNPGTVNPATYTFTATTTGDITAYFAGSTASYEEVVGLEVNGVQVGSTGLDNYSSSIGDSIDFGTVTAGSTLTFFDQVLTTGDVWYSNPALNSDNTQHVYSTSATTGQIFSFVPGGFPAGTYVAFEDEPNGFSDENYHDDTFVFTDTTLSAAVPEPATWALAMVGVAGLGMALRRQRRASAAAA